MKKIKKKPAILLTILLSVVLVVGSVFAFVPMTFGHTQYKSIAGAISLGNDFGGSMYAEYDITKESSAEDVDVQKSIQIIKSVLADEGYPSAEVHSINYDKIRVELSVGEGEDNFKDTYALLKAVGVGVFELRSSSSEEDTYVVGSRHIKGVSLSTYQSYTYVNLEFNSDGEEAFDQLLAKCGDSGSIYVCMGGQTQTSFQSKNVTGGKTLPLTFSDYNSALDFAMKVKLGTLPVELNADTVKINTIPNNSSILPIVIALGAIVLAAIVYFILRYAIMGWMNIVSTLAMAIVATILFCSIQIIEFNTSAFLALFVGFAIMTMLKNNYMQQVHGEYLQGKTIEASLESGYKKNLMGTLVTAIAILLPAIVLAFVASGIIKTMAMILVITTLLGLFESIVLLPWLMNIVEAFNKGNEKIYHIKREEV